VQNSREKRVVDRDERVRCAVKVLEEKKEQTGMRGMEREESGFTTMFCCHISQLCNL
jgi:hypothetical protein